MTEILAEVLEQRGKSHGPFRNQFRIAQDIKLMGRLISDPVIREGFDMIATKLSRVVAGDMLAEDTWLDIAGYATLLHKYTSNLSKEQTNDK